VTHALVVLIAMLGLPRAQPASLADTQLVVQHRALFVSLVLTHLPVLMNVSTAILASTLELVH
jgi:hypothetical protein